MCVCVFMCQSIRTLPYRHYSAGHYSMHLHPKLPPPDIFPRNLPLAITRGISHAGYSRPGNSRMQFSIWASQRRGCLLISVLRFVHWRGFWVCGTFLVCVAAAAAAADVWDATYWVIGWLTDLLTECTSCHVLSFHIISCVGKQWSVKQWLHLK